MKKENAFYTLVTIYEFIHMIFITTAKVAIEIPILPLSWYAAVPLLVIPFIISLLLLQDTSLKIELLFSFCLLKAMSFISLIAYLIKYIQFYLNNQELSNFSNTFVMILFVFFLIDGIIAISFFITYKRSKKNSEKLEGTICK